MNIKINKHWLHIPIISPVELGRKLLIFRLKAKMKHLINIRKRQRLQNSINRMLKPGLWDKATTHFNCELCRFNRMKYSNSHCTESPLNLYSDKGYNENG